MVKGFGTSNAIIPVHTHTFWGCVEGILQSINRQWFGWFLLTLSITTLPTPLVETRPSSAFAFFLTSVPKCQIPYPNPNIPVPTQFAFQHSNPCMHACKCQMPMQHLPSFVTGICHGHPWSCNSLRFPAFRFHPHSHGFPDRVLDKPLDSDSDSLKESRHSEFTYELSSTIQSKLPRKFIFQLESESELTQSPNSQLLFGQTIYQHVI